MEIWKDIENYKWHYQISNYGRVFSVKNKIIMKQEKMKIGYMRIQLTKEGKSQKYLVHLLVAKEFIPFVKGKKEINHIDEIKSNNHYKNLEWVTHKENMNKGTVQERKVKTNIPNIKKSMKPVYQFTKDKVFVKKWNYLNSVLEGGFTPGIVSMVCNGKYTKNSYKGFLWSFNPNEETTLNFDK